MDAIWIDVEVELFSPDVVARAAHRYTGEFFVETVLSPSAGRVAFTPKHADADTSVLALRFGNDLLDERLRAQIREETADIQTTLVQAALREASPRDTKALP